MTLVCSLGIVTIFAGGAILTGIHYYITIANIIERLSREDNNNAKRDKK